MGALRRHPWRALFGSTLALAVGLGLYFGLGYLQARDHLRSALAALDRWDFEQARSDLAVCLRFWPRDGYTRALAAQAARRAGQLDEAEAHLQVCDALGYRNHTTALESMMLSAQRGNVWEVEETLKLCVERDDLDSPLILEALALSYIHIYDVSRAGPCLDLLLSRQPGNCFALLWRGRLNAGINRFEMAKKDYRKAIELNPDYVEARLALAERLLMENAFGEAADHYQKALAQRPQDRKALLGLARCRRQLGNLDEAQRLLDELLAAHPDAAEALSHRGQVALDAQRPEEAEKYLRRAVKIEPHDEQTLFSLHISLNQQGKTAEAQEYLQRSEAVRADQARLKEVLHGLSRTPDNPDLYAEAATICLRNGQESEGLRWLNGALLKQPQHRRTHSLLADFYERKGNAELATRHRQLAARPAPMPGRQPAVGPRP